MSHENSWMDFNRFWRVFLGWSALKCGLLGRHKIYFKSEGLENNTPFSTRVVETGLGAVKGAPGRGGRT